MFSFKNLNIYTFILSVILFVTLLFSPGVLLDLFEIDGNEAVFFIARRASMFFLGYGLICFTARNAKPSSIRKSISFGISISMIGFAILGLYEFLRGFAGVGIIPTIANELFLGISYFSYYLSDRKVSAE